jgi:AbiV family abortive infection protein
MVLSESEKESLRIGERKSYDAARSHIDAAKLLYSYQKWPQSCFMAMTALEEIGKGLALQAVSAGQPNVIGLDFRVGFNKRSLDNAIRSRDAHSRKALIGAFAPLILNEGARKRHGKHPLSQIDRMEGVVLLARAGEWVKLRNMCLYAEVDLNVGTRYFPEEKIGREHSYIMIMAALEAYAEIYAPFFTFHNICVSQGKDPWRHAQIVKEIEEFIKLEVGNVDLDRLNFLANPKPLGDEAKRYESRRGA